MIYFLFYIICCFYAIAVDNLNFKESIQVETSDI